MGAPPPETGGREMAAIGACRHQLPERWARDCIKEDESPVLLSHPELARSKSKQQGVTLDMRPRETAAPAVGFSYPVQMTMRLNQGKGLSFRDGKGGLITIPALQGQVLARHKHS